MIGPALHELDTDGLLDRRSDLYDRAGWVEAGTDVHDALRREVELLNIVLALRRVGARAGVDGATFTSALVELLKAHRELQITVDGPDVVMAALEVARARKGKQKLGSNE